MRWFLRDVTGLPVRRGMGAIGAATLAAMSGCAVGPDFKAPEETAPAAWKAASDTEGAELPANWWRLFSDPTLDELVPRALEQNQDLRGALARVERARAVARQSEADFYPDIHGGASFTRERFSANRPTAPGAQRAPYTASTFSVPFDLSYEIDVWGRVRRSFEAASSAADASELDRVGMSLTVSGDVVRTYFSIRSLDAEAQVLRDAVDLRRQALEIVQGRFTSGVGNEVDVSRALTERATAEATLRGVLRRRAALENALAVLCGEAPQTFTLAPVADLPGVVSVSAGLPSNLLKRRPDVGAAVARLREANAQIGVATADFYPTFALTGSAGFLSRDLGSALDAASRTWSFGPSVSVPIFEGGRNTARLRESEAFYREREAAYRQTLLVAFREVEDSLSALSELDGEIRFQAEAQRSADRTFELASGRYRQGLVSYLDVVDAARSQLDARRAQVQLKGIQAESTVLLIKALGGGWNQTAKPGDGGAAQASVDPAQTNVR